MIDVLGEKTKSSTAPGTDITSLLAKSGQLTLETQLSHVGARQGWFTGESKMISFGQKLIATDQVDLFGIRLGGLWAIHLGVS